MKPHRWSMPGTSGLRWCLDCQETDADASEDCDKLGKSARLDAAVRDWRRRFLQRKNAR